jgi:hypothetical protein
MTKPGEIAERDAEGAAKTLRQKNWLLTKLWRALGGAPKK